MECLSIPCVNIWSAWTTSPQKGVKGHITREDALYKIFKLGCLMFHIIQNLLTGVFFLVLLMRNFKS